LHHNEIVHKYILSYHSSNQLKVAPVSAQTSVFIYRVRIDIYKATFKAYPQLVPHNINFSVIIGKLL
jgi:hypothetical protein